MSKSLELSFFLCGYDKFTPVLGEVGLVHSVGWLSTDVSGQPIGPIFKVVSKNKAFVLDTWPLKMEPTGCPETSFLNQPALRNYPEDGIMFLCLIMTRYKLDN